MQITAVVAIGWAEGLSHVNLRKVYIITLWWFGSIIPICLITAALMAQGGIAMNWRLPHASHAAAHVQQLQTAHRLHTKNAEVFHETFAWSFCNLPPAAASCLPFLQLSHEL